jgi:hypothetical protein
MMGESWDSYVGFFNAINRGEPIPEDKFREFAME